MYTLDYKKYAKSIRAAVAESVVLLKNDNNALPVKEDESIAIFGRAQIDTYYCGTGSGGMVNIPYLINFADGLLAKRKIDEELHNAYLDFIEENPFDKGVGWAQEPFSQVEMPLDEKMVLAAAKRNDIAIVVIGRLAGEDKDSEAIGGSYYLSETEKANLKLVCKHFSRVAVALNVGNIMDMSFIAQCNPSAILYTWHGGVESGNGYADVICGDVNPSGSMPDTVAINLEDYPSTENFGSATQNIYKEDIFVGYRYFETFAPERVLYPFGFGLSYSTFEINDAQYKKEADSDVYEIEVTVLNTGKIAGKKAVQIYITAPCGKLGKPKVVLVGFAKTKLINPGESDTVHIKVAERDLSSFDESISAFVIEAGEYDLRAGFSSRENKSFAKFNLETTKIIEKTADALKPIIEFDRLTAKIEDNSYKAIEAKAAVREYKIADRITNEQKPCPPKTDKGYSYAQVVSGEITTEEFVADLSDIELIHLSRGEGMCSPKVTPGTAGCFGGVTENLNITRGIPLACCSDGPSGIRMDCGTMAMSLPNATALASTMNTEIIAELFTHLSVEMLYHKADTLLGPGINIHRNPLCGRNFEYFSEDPLLTGKLAAEQIRVMNKYNVTGTIKHFTANNQEKARKVVESVISARALREIYLRAFEIAVREGGAYSLMTAYNPINGTQAASNYDLNTKILRDDWGFDGVVMTDWWATMNDEGGEASERHTAQMITAQNDVFMGFATAEGNSLNDNSEEKLAKGELTRYSLARNAVNIINTLQKFNCTKGNPEVEALNIPENKQKTVIDHGGFILDKTLSVATENINTIKGSSNKFEITLAEHGKYKIEFDLFGDAVELAQLPMSVIINGGLVKTITLKGGESGVYSCDFEMFATINIYLELFFGESGLVMNSFEIKKI